MQVKLLPLIIIYLPNKIQQNLHKMKKNNLLANVTKNTKGLKNHATMMGDEMHII